MCEIAQFSVGFSQNMNLPAKTNEKDHAKSETEDIFVYFLTAAFINNNKTASAAAFN